MIKRFLWVIIVPIILIGVIPIFFIDATIFIFTGRFGTITDKWVVKNEKFYYKYIEET